MNIGFLSPSQLDRFGPLLLPDVVQAMTRGEPVTAIGLSVDDVACGAAACYLEGAVAQIVSFYVAPDYRRRGGGRQMMETLLSMLSHQAPSSDLELHYIKTQAEHDTLPPFLEAMGFQPVRDRKATLYLTSLYQAANSPFFSGKHLTSSSIYPFSKIPSAYLSRADYLLRQQNMPLPEGSLSGRDPDRELSCALVKNDTVQALVCFDHSCMGQLTLSCAWSGSAGPGAIPALLRWAFARSRELYPSKTLLLIQSVDPIVDELIHTLLPKAHPISFTYTRPFTQF